MHLKLSPTVIEGRRAGLGRSRTFQSQREGLFPPSVKLGRSSYVPAHEVDAVIAARIAGADDDAVRTLIKQLVEKRQHLGNAVATSWPFTQAAA